MYAMNGRLCVNRSATRVQTKLGGVTRPTDTIVVAESDGNSPTAGAAQSNVIAKYAWGRHAGRGSLSFCDGHAAIVKTNDYWHPANEATDAASEWSVPRKIYWYPSPDTKD